LLLWAWRANFGLPPAALSTPAKQLHPVFVEVQGAVAHPGVYSFPEPPTLAEACRRAGGAALGSEFRGEEGKLSAGKLPSGARLEVTSENGYRLGRMTGAQLMTLGLAIDPNQASQADLEALPGIGPALAGRIIAYRQSHGPFKKIDDLLAVSGIGPKKLEKIRPYLVFGGQGAPPLDHQK